MHAAIDANKSGGIPLGGWTSFENDTAPNDDWIQAGTTFDSDTYPELFLYLGGNTVPQMFDHSRPGDYEVGTITTSNTSVNFDCLMTFKYNPSSGSGSYFSLFVNDVNVVTLSSASGGQQGATISLKKGDLIRFTGSNYGAITVNFRYYTHPMFIKATTTASSYTPSSAVQEIKDYTKDYVDAKNSYSTEETLTGGTWIDGKPIYRKTFHFNTMLSVGQYVYTVDVGQANFDTWIKTYYIGRRSNMTDIMTAYFPTWTANNYSGFKISVNDQEAMFVDYMILEYTKKTTP